MEAENRSFLDVLTAELIRRKMMNSRYSLRAYARSLGIDATLLSKILSGKNLPSIKTAEKLAMKLKLSEEDQLLFLASLISEQNLLRLFQISKNWKKRNGRSKDRFSRQDLNVSPIILEIPSSVDFVHIPLVRKLLKNFSQNICDILRHEIKKQ